MWGQNPSRRDKKKGKNERNKQRKKGKKKETKKERQEGKKYEKKNHVCRTPNCSLQSVNRWVTRLLIKAARIPSEHDEQLSITTL